MRVGHFLCAKVLGAAPLHVAGTQKLGHGAGEAPHGLCHVQIAFGDCLGTPVLYNSNAHQVRRSQFFQFSSS